MAYIVPVSVLVDVARAKQSLTTGILASNAASVFLTTEMLYSLPQRFMVSGRYTL